MTQQDRDRLVTLKKAQKKLITQKQAAGELQITERHVRRLLVKLKKGGGKVVIHGLRGRLSNRKLPEAAREKAVRILSQELYRGFGPTLASEYLQKKHGVSIGRACGAVHRSRNFSLFPNPVAKWSRSGSASYSRIFLGAIVPARQHGSGGSGPLVGGEPPCKGQARPRWRGCSLTAHRAEPDPTTTTTEDRTT